VGWKITYLKRYCLKVTDGSHHSPQTQYEGKSYISVKDVNEFGEIDTINCKKINQKDFDTYRSKVIRRLPDNVDKT